MTLSRNRLRAVAVLVAGLLLLTGAGEVLGACYCAHRGGSHDAAHVSDGQGETELPDHGDMAPQEHVAADGHDATHGHADTDGDSQEETHGPGGGMCRALCALACSVNAGPASDVTEPAPDLLFVGPVAATPPVESPDFVPVNARPHVLPLSQAPPVDA